MQYTCGELDSSVQYNVLMETIMSKYLLENILCCFHDCRELGGGAIRWLALENRSTIASIVVLPRETG